MSDQLNDFLGECVSRMESIVAETADRDLTEAETAEFNQLDEWAGQARELVEADRARAEKAAELRSVYEAAEAAGRTKFDVPSVNTRTSDPFADLDRVRDLSSDDLRSRAETIVESHLPREISDQARESILATVSKRSTSQYDADAVREHVIVSSSPAYVEAFERHMNTQGRDTDPILLNRTAMSLTAANGGVLVPQFLDPTIVLTNAGSANAVRQLAGSAQITVDQWDGVTSAGVTAEMLTEGSEAADATPTFVAPTITVNKAAAYAFGSYEVLMDSGFDEIGALVADAFDRLEESQFTNGNGATGNCTGLITALSGTGPVVAGSSGDAGAADLAVADVYALDDNLSSRYRRNATFHANKSVWNDVRQLGTSDSYHAFWTSFGGGTPAQLIGYNVYENAAMEASSSIISGSDDYPILLGDLRTGYKIVDRIGTTAVYNPLVIGSNQRPTGQAGWFFFKRFGADVITSDAFKLLKL